MEPKDFSDGAWVSDVDSIGSVLQLTNIVPYGKPRYWWAFDGDYIGDIIGADSDGEEGHQYIAREADLIGKAEAIVQARKKAKEALAELNEKRRELHNAIKTLDELEKSHADSVS